MENKTHVNIFEDVHKKIQERKDRVREANVKDSELREKRAAQAVADALEKKY